MVAVTQWERNFAEEQFDRNLARKRQQQKWVWHRCPWYCLPRWLWQVGCRHIIIITSHGALIDLKSLASGSLRSSTARSTRTSARKGRTSESYRYFAFKSKFSYHPNYHFPAICCATQQKQIYVNLRGGRGASMSTRLTTRRRRFARKWPRRSATRYDYFLLIVVT